MELIKNKVISWAAYGDSLEKIGFLKSFLACLSCEELKLVKGLCTKASAKKVNKARSWIGPRSLEESKEGGAASSSSVSLHTDVNTLEKSMATPSVCKMGWWNSYDDVVSIDVEKVSVPTNSRKNQMKAATVAVVNKKGQVVYSGTIRHNPGTFIVNFYTKKINGFTDQSLKDGEEETVVVEALKDILKGNKLVIGVAIADDLLSLGLNPSEYNLFDLQSFYKRESKVNPYDVHPMSLRDIYFYYFRKDIQGTIHSAATDAKGQMRIFMFGLKKETIEERVFTYEDQSAPNLRQQEKLGFKFCNDKCTFMKI